MGCSIARAALLHATQRQSRQFWGPSNEEGSWRAVSQRGVRRLRQHLPVAEAQERRGRQAIRQGRQRVAARHRDRTAHHAHQRAVHRHPAHRHEPLLRQPRAAAQYQRQFHRHELVPVRAPPLPARRLRGDRLPPAHRPAQELLRYPHGHGYPRLSHPRHLLRRVRHPVGRRGLHARAAPPARARSAYGHLRQRLHGCPLYGHQRRRGTGVRI